LAAAALGADQPLSPIGHSRFGAVPLGHLGRIGLNLMAAILAPNDQPDAGAGGTTQRHRRAGLGLQVSALDYLWRADTNPVSVPIKPVIAVAQTSFICQSSRRSFCSFRIADLNSARACEFSIHISLE
jgi:hypothetical protein